METLDASLVAHVATIPSMPASPQPVPATDFSPLSREFTVILACLKLSRHKEVPHEYGGE